MDQQGSKPRIEPKPEEMPQIVEPPKPDNQLEVPKAEELPQEELEDIVAPSSQKESHPPVVSQEKPRMAESEIKVTEPAINTNSDQKAVELIDIELPADQGLDPFNQLGDDVAKLTDPKETIS